MARMPYFEAMSKQKIEWGNQARKGLAFIWVIFIAPLAGLFIYQKLVGWEFVGTEIGQLVMIGVALLSALLGMLLWSFLFSKYLDDINFN